MQAMILAAGFGTRLLPYTKLRPKPLFPLLNESLLLLTIRHLQAAGFDHIVVNCHYLREQIVTALTGLAGVLVQEEEIVLGTGGGLRLAMSNLRDEPLLVSNGDIYHTVDCKELYLNHQAGDAAVTMAMHDYPRFNKVSVHGDMVTGFDEQSGENCLAFTGLHVLDPDVLELIPLKQNYSIIDRYRGLLQEGKTIKALRVDGCSWTDMGTVEDYLDLHASLLKETIPRWPEFANAPETGFLVHDEATVGEGCEMLDWASVGRAQLEDNVSLKRCIVWDDALVPKGTNHCDSLLV
jgi:mannose-1-phosphate guanylyltransferase